MKSHRLGVASSGAILAAVALVPVLVLVPLQSARSAPRTPPAAPGQEAPAGPALKLGRAKLEHITVARDSRHSSVVLLRNEGSELASVTKVTVQGDPLKVKLVRERVSVPVALDTAMAYEVPAGQSAQLEVTIDAKDQKLGERSATIVVEAGATRLELPVAWEVVEPRADADEERPIAKPKTDLSQFAPKGPPPILNCDRYLHEFGEVLSGERLKTTFTVRNDGEGDLVLVKVGAQCHCTLPRLTLPNGVVPGKQLARDEVYGTLKKGEQATLEVEVDTAGMKGFYKKTVAIITNDAVRSPQHLNLTMTVDSPVDFNPANATFGEIRRGERLEQLIRMSTKTLGKFAITGFELPQPQPFDVEFREVATRKDEQCAWELVLRSRDDLPCKEYRGRLRLEVDHPKIKTLDQLNYSLRVVPDVMWTFEKRRSPESINLGVVWPGTNDVQTLVLENKNSKVPYVPTEAKMSSNLGDEPFQAEIVEVEKGQRYEVLLKVVSPPKLKAFKGSLLIKSDSPTLPELKLGFTGIWGGGSAPAPAKSSEAKAPAKAPDAKDGKDGK